MIPRSVSSLWLSTLAAGSLALTFVGGCAGVQVPSINLADKLGALSDIGAPGGGTNSRFRPVGSDVELASATLTEPVYNAVQRAKRENSVVLQVLGDDAPIRVLPLPPADSGGQPPRGAYVSQLLTETGVQQKLGRIEATLFRAQQGSIGGIRMDVIWDDDSDQIRPETDYALRPGDRLVVSRNSNLEFGSVMGLMLGK